MFQKHKASIEIICSSLNKEPQDNVHHTLALSIIIYASMSWMCSDNENRITVEKMLRQNDFTEDSTTFITNTAFLKKDSF